MISVKNIENISRKAWLAGLGSLAWGKEFATSKLDKAYTETNQLMTSLMSTGEKLSESEEHGFPAVDERISQIREKLGLDNKQPDQLQELEQRVAHLTDVVNKLVEKKSGEAAAKPKARKPRVSRTKAANAASADKAEAVSAAKEKEPAKKTTARKSAATRKTTAAKKPATRKASAKKPAVKTVND